MFDDLKKGLAEQKKGPRKVNYVWVLAGGYLIYLGGKLLWECYKNVNANPVICVIAGIIFMVVGGLVIRREWFVYRNSIQNPETDEEEAEELPGEELPADTEESEP